MCCPKCQGWMMPEQAGDVFDRFTLFACINCGERVDETIAKNRQLPPLPRKQWERYA